MNPLIQKPFADHVFGDLRRHVREIRRLLDWPGLERLDPKVYDPKFERWYFHQIPAIRSLHRNERFIRESGQIFGEEVKPTYAYLSMYSSKGDCPMHRDRPQCKYTVDLLVDADGPWPLYVEGRPYVLGPGEAVYYSGTDHVHGRKPMPTDGRGCTFMNLVFFHFVPVSSELVADPFPGDWG